MKNDSIEALTKAALYFCASYTVTKEDVENFKKHYKMIENQYKDFFSDSDIRKRNVFKAYRFGDSYVDANKFDQFFMMLNPEVRNKIYLNLNSDYVTGGEFYYTEFTIDEVDDLY